MKGNIYFEWEMQSQQISGALASHASVFWNHLRQFTSNMMKNVSYMQPGSHCQRFQEPVSASGPEA